MVKFSGSFLKKKNKAETLNCQRAPLNINKHGPLWNSVFLFKVFKHSSELFSSTAWKSKEAPQNLWHFKEQRHTTKKTRETGRDNRWENEWTQKQWHEGGWLCKTVKSSESKYFSKCPVHWTDHSERPGCASRATALWICRLSPLWRCHYSWSGPPRPL